LKLVLLEVLSDFLSCTSFGLIVVHPTEILNNFLCRWAHFRVLVDHFEEKSANIPPQSKLRLKRSLLTIRRMIEVILIAQVRIKEGHLSRKQLEKDNSTGVNIEFHAIVRVTWSERVKFRGAVGRCSDSRRLTLFIGDDLCCAEIGNLDVEIRIYEHIVKFQITMHDPLFVAVNHSLY